MPLYFDRPRKRWRYEFSRVIGGRRCRATKLLPQAWSRQQAEAYAQEQDAHLYAVATGATRAQPLISEAVRLYLTEHAQGLKNRAKLERDLALTHPAYAGRRLNELPDVVRQYVKDNPGLSTATVRVRMAYLRAACRWAWKTHDLGDHDPAEKVTLPTVRNERHRYIGRGELLRIARAITDRPARQCVLVAFYSGMRLGEVLRAVPTRGGWLLEDTKNGERRMVPIHPKVSHLSRMWPPKIEARRVQGRFLAAARGCGFDDLRFHDLRHSAASEMINAGVPLYTVGAVLGHRAAASTKRYSHLSTDSLNEALNRIGKRR